jgi:hypothetical protein
MRLQDDKATQDLTSGRQANWHSITCLFLTCLVSVGRSGTTMRRLQDDRLKI